MHILPWPLDDDTLRPFIHDWINLLATEQFGQALAVLYAGAINPYGLNPHYAGMRWNADLLGQVIHNYGLFDDERDGMEERPYHVLPVQPVNVQVVDTGWWLDVITSDTRDTWALDSRRYAGVVHVYLPMDYAEDSARLSDVCARFCIRRITATQVALELDTVHVL